MTRLLIALLLLVSLSSRTASQARPSRTTVRTQVDSLVSSFLATGPGASVAFAVVRGRDTLAMGAAGKADLAGGRLADATTIYRIGSLTKQFTAAMILRLAEQRKLSLDDTLGRHLAGLPSTWQPITSAGS